MMEKYGTYTVFRNTITKEIKSVPIDDIEEMQKTASDSFWERLEKDPEDETENQ